MVVCSQLLAERTEHQEAFVPLPKRWRYLDRWPARQRSQPELTARLQPPRSGSLLVALPLTRSLVYSDSFPERIPIPLACGISGWWCVRRNHRPGRCSAGRAASGLPERMEPRQRNHRTERWVWDSAPALCLGLESGVRLLTWIPFRPLASLPRPLPLHPLRLFSEVGRPSTYTSEGRSLRRADLCLLESARRTCGRFVAPPSLDRIR